MSQYAEGGIEPRSEKAHEIEDNAYKNHVVESQFFQELLHDVVGPRKGGAIIFVDAENARKGVAKTSGAVAVARLLARSFNYGLQKDDLTLSGAQYLKRYQEHPGQGQPSVLVLDEFVGAGSGDSRRAMSTQNIDFSRAWQLLRTKRVVTLATLPDWNEADPRLQKLADYRLWCRERPIGFFQPYKITVPFSGGKSNIRLKGLGYGRDTDRICFPNMDAHGDPYYEHVSRKKSELIGSETWDADEQEGEEDDEEGDELTPEDAKYREKVAAAIRLYEPWNTENEHSYEEVAPAVDRSRQWVGQRVREWKRGEHRDIVADPQEE
jgi:hypothetical protein